MVGFKLGTSDCTIISIVSSVHGQVIGQSVALSVYQVKLDRPATSVDELAKFIAVLKTFPDVIFAEPNGVGDENRAGDLSH